LQVPARSTISAAHHHPSVVAPEVVEAVLARATDRRGSQLRHR
jgi:hypothetical protein